MYCLDTTEHAEYVSTSNVVSGSIEVHCRLHKCTVLSFDITILYLQNIIDSARCQVIIPLYINNCSI